MFFPFIKIFIFSLFPYIRFSFFFPFLRYLYFFFISLCSFFFLFFSIKIFFLYFLVFAFPFFHFLRYLYFPFFLLFAFFFFFLFQETFTTKKLKYSAAVYIIIHLFMGNLTTNAMTFLSCFLNFILNNSDL